MVGDDATGWRDRLYRKLSLVSSLSRQEFAQTEALIENRRAFRRDEIIEAPGYMGVVRDGWCYRYRLLADGRRSVFNFWLPGDIFRLTPIKPGLKSSVSAVGEAELVMIADGDFQGLCAASPALADAFHAHERLDALLLGNQVLRLSRLTAYERVIHLLLELWDRLNLVGLAGPDHSFEMPVPHTMLADMLGLSNVHISRTFTRLREEGLVESRRGQVVLRDPATLIEIVEYDPLRNWLPNGPPAPAGNTD